MGILTPEQYLEDGLGDYKELAELYEESINKLLKEQSRDNLGHWDVPVIKYRRLNAAVQRLAWESRTKVDIEDLLTSELLDKLVLDKYRKAGWDVRHNNWGVDLEWVFSFPEDKLTTVLEE